VALWELVKVPLDAAPSGLSSGAIGRTNDAALFNSPFKHANSVAEGYAAARLPGEEMEVFT
jgi:hypothetical protein